jgi:hypothetical protein
MREIFKGVRRGLRDEIRDVLSQPVQAVDDAKAAAIRDVKATLKQARVEVSDAELEESYSIFSGESLLDRQRANHHAHKSCNSSLNVPAQEPIYKHDNVLNIPSSIGGDSEPGNQGSEILIKKERDWYDFEKIVGPRKENPVWNVDPMILCSPELLVEIAGQRVKDGKWTETEAQAFIRKTAAAYVAPVSLASDLQTNSIPTLSNEQGINTILNLGLEGDLSAEAIRKQFQHGITVWYPIGLYPAIVRMYCDTDSITRRITGWNQEVKDFFNGVRSSLPTLESSGFLIEARTDPRDQLAKYLIKYGIDASGDCPSIQTTMRWGMAYILSNVPGVELASVLDLAGYVASRDEGELRFSVDEVQDIVLARPLWPSGGRIQRATNILFLRCNSFCSLKICEFIA